MYRIVLAFAFATFAQAAIINVPTDQPTIQAGIDAAKDGDEVVVAPGEYFENINLRGKAITLRSADPTDAATVLATIINGGGAGTVIRCNNKEGKGTQIDGFVVTGGADTSSGGGGMINGEGTSHRVLNCVFIENVAEEGGAVTNGNASPTFIRCSFIKNSAKRDGGAIRNEAKFGAAMFIDCIFDSNAAQLNGGAIISSRNNFGAINCVFTNNSAQNGAGAYLIDGAPEFRGCSFRGNEATDQGGAIFLMANDDFLGATPEFINSTFIGNRSSIGGAIYSQGVPARFPEPAFTNCEFSHNHAIDLGGAIYSRRSDITLDYCSLTGNDAHFGGGIYNAINSTTAFMNCWLSGNEADFGHAMYSAFKGAATASGTVFCGEGSPILGPLTDGGNNIISEVCPPPRPACLPPNPGDFDGDDDVDLVDFANFQLSFTGAP